MCPPPLFRASGIFWRIIFVGVSGKVSPTIYPLAYPNVISIHKWSIIRHRDESDCLWSDDKVKITYKRAKTKHLWVSGETTPCSDCGQTEMVFDSCSQCRVTLKTTLVWITARNKGHPRMTKQWNLSGVSERSIYEQTRKSAEMTFLSNSASGFIFSPRVSGSCRRWSH